MKCFRIKKNKEVEQAIDNRTLSIIGHVFMRSKKACLNTINILYMLVYSSTELTVVIAYSSQSAWLFEKTFRSHALLDGNMIRGCEVLPSRQVRKS